MPSSDSAPEEAERPRAEGTLREHDELFRLLAENAHDLIRLHQHDGRSVYASPSVVQFLGKEPAELFDPIHSDDLEKGRQWWQNILSGGKEQIEWRALDAAGRWRWFETSAALVQYHDKPHVVTICRDITDRKRVEQQLWRAEEDSHRSKDELHLVIDTIPVMAWTVRPDGVVDFLNRRWVSYYGLSLEQYVVDQAGPIHPEDVARVFGKWRVQMAIGEAYDDEMRLRRSDGEYRWFLVRTAPLRDEQGNVVKWYGVSTDIEDRKRAEEASRESAHRLRHLNRRLLEVQEEERRHLARELHDEFGQLLAGITLHLLAAKRVAGEAAQVRLEECIALLQRACEEVRNLALELRPTMLEIAGLEAALRWLAGQHQQQTGIATQVVGHLNGVPGDLAIACFRVVQEALTNVVRHARAQHVWIELSGRESELLLVVRDDGVGFDVDRTLGQAEAPQRLGLLGMRERVELFGGDLEVDSAPQRGTRIRARFPLAEAATEPA
jgi:PAS domain S-box-containing protein